MAEYTWNSAFSMLGGLGKIYFPHVAGVDRREVQSLPFHRHISTHSQIASGSDSCSSQTWDAQTTCHLIMAFSLLASSSTGSKNPKISLKLAEFKMDSQGKVSSDHHNTHYSNGEGSLISIVIHLPDGR